MLRDDYLLSDLRAVIPFSTHSKVTLPLMTLSLFICFSRHNPLLRQASNKTTQDDLNHPRNVLNLESNAHEFMAREIEAISSTV